LRGFSKFPYSFIEQRDENRDNGTVGTSAEPEAIGK